MVFILTAKTENGTKALQSMLDNKGKLKFTAGARITKINDDPLRIKIELLLLGKIKKIKSISSFIEESIHDIMTNFDAKKEDYDVVIKDE